MPADKTYIFIVISLYCWDIKPVFTQNVPTFRKWSKRVAENNPPAIVHYNFCFIVLFSNSFHFPAVMRSGQKNLLDISSTKPRLYTQKY